MIGYVTCHIKNNIDDNDRDIVLSGDGDSPSDEGQELADRTMV